MCFGFYWVDKCQFWKLVYWDVMYFSKLFQSLGDAKWNKDLSNDIQTFETTMVMNLSVGGNIDEWANVLPMIVL